MKRITFIFALVLAIIASSCDTSVSTDSYTQGIDDCFVYAKDKATGKASVATNVDYSLEVDNVTETCKLTIFGLKIDGESYGTLVFPNLKFSYQNAWFTITESQLVPQGKTTPVLTNFTLRMLGRSYQNVSCPAVYVSFDVDSKYEVFSSYSGQILGGTTISAGGGNTCSSESTIYFVTFNFEKWTMNIDITRLQFSQAMSDLMAVTFENIPFTMDGDKITFAAEEFTPKLYDTLYTNLKGTELSGEFDFATGMKMDCKLYVPSADTTFSIGSSCYFFVQKEK